MTENLTSPHWTEAEKAIVQKIIETCQKPNGCIDYKRVRTELADDWNLLSTNRTLKVIQCYISFIRRRAGTNPMKANKKPKRKVKAEMQPPVVIQQTYRKVRPEQEPEILACPRCLTSIHLITVMIGKTPNHCPKCDANLLAVSEALKM